MGRGSGRGRESQADSTHSMEPDVGLDLMILRSQPEPKPRDAQTTVPPRCPSLLFLTASSCNFFLLSFKTLCSANMQVPAGIRLLEH